MRKAYLLIISLLFLGANVSTAQDVWSLEKCIDHALNESIGIQQSELNILNSEIDLDLAKQARNPNLNASSGVGWNFGRTIEPTTNAFITETFFSNNYGLNSGVIIFDGFRIKNNIKKSGLDLDAAKADKEQVKQDLALNIALAYLNILFSKENIEIAKKQKSLNEKQLVQIDKSIAAGALPKADRLNLEAQVAQSEQNIIVAENAYEIGLLQLKQFLRLEPSEAIEVEVPTDFSVGTDPDMLTFEELLNEALKRRYDLRAAELRAEGATLDIDIAKSAYYPTLTAFGNLRTNYSNQARELTGFEIETIQQDFTLGTQMGTVTTEIEQPVFQKPGFSSQLDQFLSYGFGLGLTIPIYNNGINKGNVQRANLNVENQKLMKDQLVENFKQSVMQALADARAAKRKLAASEKSLEAQQLAFDNVTKRLELGATNSFEWETQKTQLENLELSRLNDKYDYLFKVKILDFYLGKPLNF